MPSRNALSSDESINRALRMVRGGEQDIAELGGSGAATKSSDVSVDDIVQSTARTALSIMQNQPEGVWGIFSEPKLKAAIRLKLLEQVEIVMTGQNAITRALVTSWVMETGMRVADKVNELWRKFWVDQAPQVRRAIRAELVNYKNDIAELLAETLPEELEREGMQAFDETHQTAMNMLRHQIAFDENGYMCDARALASTYAASSLTSGSAVRRQLPGGHGGHRVLPAEITDVETDGLD